MTKISGKMNSRTLTQYLQVNRYMIAVPYVNRYYKVKEIFQGKNVLVDIIVCKWYNKFVGWVKRGVKHHGKENLYLDYGRGHWYWA